MARRDLLVTDECMPLDRNRPGYGPVASLLLQRQQPRSTSSGWHGRRVDHVLSVVHAMPTRDHVAVLGPPTSGHEPTIGRHSLGRQVREGSRSDTTTRRSAQGHPERSLLSPDRHRLLAEDHRIGSVDPAGSAPQLRVPAVGLGETRPVVGAEDCDVVDADGMVVMPGVPSAAASVVPEHKAVAAPRRTAEPPCLRSPPPAPPPRGSTPGGFELPTQAPSRRLTAPTSPSQRNSGQTHPSGWRLAHRPPTSPAVPKWSRTPKLIDHKYDHVAGARKPTEQRLCCSAGPRSPRRDDRI